MTRPLKDNAKDSFETNSSGETCVRVIGKDTGSLLEGVAFDYVSVAYPDSTTEVYTYKSGGSGGATVATITVVYTSASKNNISTVTKS